MMRIQAVRDQLLPMAWKRACPAGVTTSYHNAVRALMRAKPTTFCQLNCIDCLQTARFVGAAGSRWARATLPEDKGTPSASARTSR